VDALSALFLVSINMVSVVAVLVVLVECATFLSLKITI
jgi:hypothetical protein